MQGDALLSPWGEGFWTPTTAANLSKSPPNSLCSGSQASPHLSLTRGMANLGDCCQEQLDELRATRYVVPSTGDSVLEDLTWLRMPQATDSSRAEKISYILLPALKHVLKHPPAITGWAALFHGKFYLALVR